MVQVDVSDPKQVQEVKKEINADLGIVNILVNNAGLMPKTSLREGDNDSIRRVMDVNILSHFWVIFSTHFPAYQNAIHKAMIFFQTTRTFIDDMIERHSGYIVGIASMLSLYPMSTTILYSASKFAVKGFMEALTRESLHENWGVKTLTVFPHFTNTRKEMIDFARQTMGYVKRPNCNTVVVVSICRDKINFDCSFNKSDHQQWNEWEYENRLKLPKKLYVLYAVMMDVSRSHATIRWA